MDKAKERIGKKKNDSRKLDRKVRKECLVLTFSYFLLFWIFIYHRALGFIALKNFSQGDLKI